jgi:probable blue pigment (indigoidine) exporter
MNLAGYAYLSLAGSALAYAVWFRGIDRLPAFSVSLLGPLSPLVATLLGWAVLDERLTGFQLLGAAVALGGVVAGQSLGNSTTPALGTEADRPGRGPWRARLVVTLYRYVRGSQALPDVR